MYAILILIIIPFMSFAQLNENILFEKIDNFKNIDFRKLDATNHTDYSIDIEYNADYYYEPNYLDIYTFLDYPINGASFYVTEDEHIKSFGLRLECEDATEFYKKMFEEYGQPLVVSHSAYFFEKHGVILPKSNSEESLRILESIPFPTVDEYKNMVKLNWYLKDIGLLNRELVISIYNISRFGEDFSSSARNLRIIIREVEK